MSISSKAEPRSAHDLEVVRLRRPWRLVSGAVIAILVAKFVDILITNDRFQWDVVWHYLTFGQIMQGLARTIVLTACAMLIGILGGILLATMRLSVNPLVSWVAGAYIWFFRGTPVLVQLIFWFNLSALFPAISLGIPFGPQFVEFDANQVITVYVAALLGLGLNEAAYMAEIVRSGINSVDRGQLEASQALGMGRFLTFRRVVMPQAMRVIVPPTGNQVIGMLKTTSLVSVIALPDLLYSAQLIYNRNFNPIPLLIVASLWYLLLTSILSVAQYYIERHYNRGHHGTTGRSRPQEPQRPRDGQASRGHGLGTGNAAEAGNAEG
ncbi:amino acid ABC transporter permease [Saccharopolyspora phatthalungensis]|uniref:Polar amino acid transport system permease protein n=1 Tax=Saccharopolyspora phatthalungensis TaxID=664693 RepID=A0A840QEY6_9PSEU|nr:amino acid ABC transporter permease [Saccharopolyspora phatthalungensis]MBB5157149.1 polar amino acid transport system permease protein [Saccharopolyspora phatthalungensis]